MNTLTKCVDNRFDKLILTARNWERDLAMLGLDMTESAVSTPRYDHDEATDNEYDDKTEDDVNEESYWKNAYKNNTPNWNRNQNYHSIKNSTLIDSMRRRNIPVLPVIPERGYSKKKNLAKLGRDLTKERTISTPRYEYNQFARNDYNGNSDDVENERSFWEYTFENDNNNRNQLPRRITLTDTQNPKKVKPVAVLPEHIQKHLKNETNPNPLDDETGELYRGGLNDYNIVKYVCSPSASSAASGVSSETEVSGSGKRSNKNKKFKKLLKPVKVVIRMKQPHPSIKSKESSKDKDKDKQIADDIIENDASLRKKGKGIQRRTRFVYKDHLVTMYSPFKFTLNNDCGLVFPWAETRYNQAANWIRYELPSHMKVLEEMTPLEYLHAYTLLKPEMENRYKRLFNQFKDKKKTFIDKAKFFPALDKLCGNYLWQNNYEILRSSVLKHTIDSLDERRFAVLCSVCERRYWSLYFPEHVTNGVVLGCRTRLEYLDFNTLPYKFQDYNISLLVQNLLVSLA